MLVAEFVSATPISEEPSFVAPSNFFLDSNRSGAWLVLHQRFGSLSLAEVGILAGTAAVLAEEKISIFAISTDHTDCVLLKNPKLEPAIVALAKRYRIA